jgi:hypothetical protein
MEDINYEGLLGMMSEMNKKLDVIQTNSKVKENQPVNRSVSKEEIEAIVKERTDFLGKYVEYKHKIQTEHHRNLNSAIKVVEEKIDALPVAEKVSLEPILNLLPKSKKVTICGFEFFRTSVVIFVLTLISFFSLVLNIKQMDDCRALKGSYCQQTEYIYHMQNMRKEDGKE